MCTCQNSIGFEQNAVCVGDYRKEEEKLRILSVAKKKNICVRPSRILMHMHIDDNINIIMCIELQQLYCTDLKVNGIQI